MVTPPPARNNSITSGLSTIQSLRAAISSMLLVRTAWMLKPVKLTLPVTGSDKAAVNTGACSALTDNLKRL